jgi:uncharacterized repeat protein (TIGR03803 family)
MKTSFKSLFLLPVLLAGLGLIPAARVAAQTFKTLYSFTDGGDGDDPKAGLISSGNTFYGMAYYGGSSGDGTVFGVCTNGTGFATVHSFTNGSDGAHPQGGLTLGGNILYGTTTGDFSPGWGTVFSVSTNGADFRTLYSFTNGSDGANPRAGLVLSGNTLYGTAYYGGSSGDGTVFALNTNGTGFRIVHGFAFGSDGSNPEAGLILSGNTLYGTAVNGGSWSAGTVFAVNTSGFGFTNLHNFTGGCIGGPDGEAPYGGLVLSGNTLYGTAWGGGISFRGTVFKVNTDGTGYITLHNFPAISGSLGTNSDGAYPFGGLSLSGNTLYGTAQCGGASGWGTVFALSTSGAGFTTLYSFACGCDGANPQAGLILSGNTLCGTASGDNSPSDGTVFSLLIAPQLSIVPAGANVVLSWPTNAAGFGLQAATNLVPPVSWNAVSPVPVIVNGQNAVTNAITGAVGFYRLSQ